MSAPVVVQTIAKFRIGGNKPASGSFSTLPVIGNVVVVVASVFADAGATITCGDNQGSGANTYTELIRSANTASTHVNLSIIYACVVAVSSGTFTVSVSDSGTAAGTFITAAACEVGNLNTLSGALVGATATANPSGTETSKTVTDTTTGVTQQIVFASCTTNNGTNITFTNPSSPWVTLYNEGGGASFTVGGGSYQIVSALGSYGAQFQTSVAASMTACAVALKGWGPGETLMMMGIG